MLSRLSITNYALIKSLEMEPDKALNIITGETGAGKSIMLGAVGLLLGNRADTKVLYDEQQKCIIEGEFKIEAYDLKDIFDEVLNRHLQCLVQVCSNLGPSWANRQERETKSEYGRTQRRDSSPSRLGAHLSL